MIGIISRFFLGDNPLNEKKKYAGYWPIVCRFFSCIQFISSFLRKFDFVHLFFIILFKIYFISFFVGIIAKNIIEKKNDYEMLNKSKIFFFFLLNEEKVLIQFPFIFFLVTLSDVNWIVHCISS